MAASGRLLVVLVLTTQTLAGRVEHLKLLRGAGHSAAHRSRRVHHHAAHQKAAQVDDTLGMLNDQALALRQELESLGFQCEADNAGAGSQGVRTRIVQNSADMSSNVAQQNAERLLADSTLVDRREARDSLAALQRQCTSRLEGLKTEQRLLQEDLARARKLSGLAKSCSSAAANSTSSEAASSNSTSSSSSASESSAANTSSLMEFCQTDQGGIVLPQHGGSQGSRRINFSSKTADNALREAMQRASVETQGVQLLQEDQQQARLWPEEREPLTGHDRQRRGTCENDRKSVVNCVVFERELGQLQGGLEAQLSRAAQTAHQQHEICQHHQQLGQSVLEAEQQAEARAQEGLSTQISSLADLTTGRDAVFGDQLAEDAQEESHSDCLKRVTNLQTELDQVIAIRNQLNGQAVQDCIVSEWAFAPCAVTCTLPGGSPGYREGTRRALVPQGPGGLPCPPLSVHLACGQQPCAVDCEMGAWEEWGTCSKTCGGGIRGRQRPVLTAAAHGGRACLLGTEREECAIGSCDEDCTLADWSDWSPCSVRCRMDPLATPGHQVRERQLLSEASGMGVCPAEGAVERHLQRDCNVELCPEGTQCGGRRQDILLLLQGTDPLNFEYQVKLARFLVNRSTEAVHFGVASYGAHAQVLSPVTDDREALEAALASATSPSGSPDLAQGEAMVLSLLRSAGPAGSRVQTVLTLTDGDPLQPEEALTVSRQIQVAEARLVFGVVDSRSHVARRAICDMASQPCNMNVATSNTWAEMARDAGKILAMVCSRLVLAET